MSSSWIETILENCIDILDSQRIPINNEDRQKRIDGKPDANLFPYYGATGQVGLIDDYIFDEELIALGEDGVPFLDPFKPKAYLLAGKTWVNNHAHVLKAIENVSTNKFLLYFLNQFDYQDYVNGGTRLKLTQANMRNIPIVLPPLAEQQEIATRLDALLAQVDTIKTRLDTIPAILKRFRQSVLAAAVSKQANWKVVKLSSLCDSVSDGDHQAPPKSESGIPFLVISNLSQGKVDLSTVDRFVPKTYYSELKKIRIPEKNDILYTVTGSFGISVIVETDQPFCFQRHIAIIKPNKDLVDFRFLNLFLSSTEAKNQAEAVATGTAQKTVPLSGLRNFDINLPPLAEQTEIVKRVEQLLAFAEQIEQQVQSAQNRVNNLTQAILAKAFKGELTVEWRAQNPELISGENSAAALLERIQQTAKPTKTKAGKTQQGQLALKPNH